MASFPPIKLQASKPISQSAALAHLQTYLSLSEQKENAHLLPNATLSSTGPTAKGEVGGNLVLHNLKRVEAGLRGEWLAPVFDLEEDVDMGIAIGGGLGEEGVQIRDEAMEEEENVEGWQDLEEYQREQSIETGEVAPEKTEVGQEGEVMVSMEPPVATPMDKEARKRAKKERALKEKKERVKKVQRD